MPQAKTREQIELERLWRFEGRDAAFWKELLLVFGRQTDAASGGILIRSQDDEATSWSFLAIWPDSEETKQRFSSQHAHLSQMADQQVSGQEEGFHAVEVVENLRAGALRLNLENAGVHCVAVFLRYGNEDFFHPSSRIVKLMADTPLIYGADPESQLAEERKSVQRHHSPEMENSLTPVISLGLIMNREKRFLASAMLLCNELTARFEADQVSLGWKKGSYIKILATNHAGKVEGKMETTRLLAAAMEECVDQDDEIVFPGEETARAIYRDHETYAKKEGLRQLVSIPIRSGGEPIAAFTLERSMPFEEAELNVLRLIADLVSHRLVDLKTRDRWFGSRIASALYQGLKKVFGMEHTLLKVSLLAVSGLITFLALFPVSYRVEAPFTLKADEIYQLPAPFEGYIETVNVRVGDAVKADEILVVMDTTELNLQISELSSTIDRFLAEAKLARAESSPTEVHIAVAKAYETKAELEKIKFNRQMANLIAPEDSFVVDGDLKERIGSPVSKGEPLIQLSKLDGMYAELHVSEKDIHRIEVNSMGQVAFTGRPELKFPFDVTEIEPVAVPEETGNILVTRTEFSSKAMDWWRPGMSGVAKIDCGKRSLLWIYTHRATDYLRLKFWF